MAEDIVVRVARRWKAAWFGGSKSFGFGFTINESREDLDRWVRILPHGVDPKRGGMSGKSEVTLTQEKMYGPGGVHLLDITLVFKGPDAKAEAKKLYAKVRREFTERDHFTTKLKRL